MTSESMILNRDGITLASDLAITTPENKSYNCGNKIFQLNEDSPVGIMINGKIDFEGISLETLIGEFGKTIDFDKIKTVENVKNEFIEYISLNTDFTSFDDYLKSVLDDFKNELIEEIAEYGFLETLDYYKQEELSSDLKSFKNFSNEFFDIIPDDVDKDKYNLEIWKIFSRQLSYEGTGIIFAGFDKYNFYPTFFEINLHCNDYGKIIYDEVDSSINSEKPIIKVFAINEEAYAFITGVSEDFEEYIEEYIRFSNNDFIKIFKEKLTDKDYSDEEVEKLVSCSKLLLDNVYDGVHEDINKFRLNILDEVSQYSEFLPKLILWDYANHLIKISALKQKFSSEDETVSIETEIAHITKHNGFEWIKKENVKFK